MNYECSQLPCKHVVRWLFHVFIPTWTFKKTFLCLYINAMPILKDRCNGNCMVSIWKKEQGNQLLITVFHAIWQVVWYSHVITFIEKKNNCDLTEKKFSTTPKPFDAIMSLFNFLHLFEIEEISPSNSKHPVWSIESNSLVGWQFGFFGLGILSEHAGISQRK